MFKKAIFVKAIAKDKETKSGKFVWHVKYGNMFRSYASLLEEAVDDILSHKNYIDIEITEIIKI